MKTSQLKEFIRTIVKSDTHLPLMIWGSPGIGKSAIIQQIAQEEGIECIDLRLSLLNPVDLRGLPLVNRESHKAEWLSPDFLPNGKSAEKGILFLDEINLAPASVMSAGYQLILDRKLGSYRLPDGWKIFAAGNRAEDQANVTKFPAPLSNRFIHIDLEADLEEWRKWALGHNVSPEIISFLSKMPQHLFKMPKSGEKSFPTPRSWGNASRLLNLGLPINYAVGEGVAAEFRAFCKVYDKFPNIEDIFLGKDVDVPKENDVLWALTIALVVRCEIKDIPVFFKYVEKFPKEFEVLAITSLSDKSSEFDLALVNSNEWSDWIKNNPDIIESGSE